MIFLGDNSIARITAGFRYWDFTMAERLLTEFRIIGFYLSLLFFPHPSRLTLDYDYPLSYSALHPSTTILAIIMVTALFFLAVYTARKHRVLAFCLLWFLGNLVIESSVIPIELIYEHRLYLPSIMIAMLVANIVFKTLKPQWLSIAGMLVIAVILGFWTHERNVLWSDDVQFWKDAGRKAPEDARPLKNLAFSLQQNGRYKEAIPYYRRSFGMAEQPAILYNIGLCYSAMEYHVEAITAFRKGIEENYKPAMAYAKLGYELTMIGEFNTAIENYRQALEIDPENQAIKEDLQQLIRFLRQCGAPEACVEALIDQYPENPALKFKMGIVYEGQGKTRQAASAYEKVLSMVSAREREIYILALNHLATSHLRLGAVDKAMALFLEGAELSPDDYKFAYQLAALHAYKGNPEKSCEWLEKAVDSGFDDLNRLESDTRFNAVRDNEWFLRIQKRVKKNPAGSN
ncbi:MAG: tetratricopeptide repeat protein [Desulfobacterales bacterium]|nr:tetratricopeptide repeat protein [Desulfobacterales bacterium]